MRLIDPKQAKEFANTFFGDPVLKMAVNAAMDNVTTVDAVEVVHGRWKLCGANFYQNFYNCSVCSASYDGRPNYCPNCGAKMDGEVQP